MYKSSNRRGVVFRVVLEELRGYFRMREATRSSNLLIARFFYLTVTEKSVNSCRVWPYGAPRCVRVYHMEDYRTNFLTLVQSRLCCTLYMTSFAKSKIRWKKGVIFGFDLCLVYWCVRGWSMVARLLVSELNRKSWFAFMKQLHSVYVPECHYVAHPEWFVIWVQLVFMERSRGIVQAMIATGNSGAARWHVTT